MSGPLLSRASHEVMQRTARFSGVRRAAMAWARRAAPPVAAGVAAGVPAGAADPVQAGASTAEILADLGCAAMREAGDGSHHFLLQSHRPGWKQLTVEAFRKTRWTDAQIRAGYGAPALRGLHGAAGLGFAEDTFGLHKAQSPSVHPRLLVSLVFQLNDDHLEDHGNLATRLLLPPVAEGQAA